MWFYQLSITMLGQTCVWQEFNTAVWIFRVTGTRGRSPADHGFIVEEDLAIHGAKLEIPAFTRGKKQLSQKVVKTSQQVSAVHIHVERIIGLLKNRYTILKGPLPVSLLKHKGDAYLANIDKVLIVCSALTNCSNWFQWHKLDVQHVCPFRTADSILKIIAATCEHPSPKL